MAPGPQKKFPNRKATGSKTPVLEQRKAPLPNSDLGIQQDGTNEKELPDVSDQKYAKRTVKCNWDKYNEAVVDQHADLKRGNEFETMLNYSGGTNSQLQLLDEKDWNETCTDDKNISIDFPNLITALKCIPLHVRLNLEESIFHSNQVSRFISIAENNKKQYLSHNIDKPDAQLSQLETVISNLNIIESTESEDVETQQLIKSSVVKSNTENLIESLASCLSIKDKTSDVECFKEDSSALQDSSKTVNTADDLDFLLSLSVKTDTVSKIDSNTNVDDWLSSILDN